MSQQKGMSFKEFRQRFQTEEACEAYLFEQRWPRGFVCPKCGGTGYYRLNGRREYACKHCHRQSSVTAGTVLHCTHLQSYFDEFCFRFNRRFWPDQLFPRLVCAVAVSNILGYADLTR